MKTTKRTLALLAVIIFCCAAVLGCAKPAANDGGSAAEPVKENVKIAILNNNTKESNFWTASHYNEGAVPLEGVEGVEVIWVENVPETGNDIIGVVDEVVENGAQLVIATSYGCLEAFKEAAKNHPDVMFYHCDSFDTFENFGVFNVRNYEAVFLQGYLAAKMASGDVLGYIGTQPMPSVMRLINGFALGAKHANPNARVKVIFINSWFDATKEKEAANALIDDGASVVCTATSSPTVPQTAQERGVYAMGYSYDVQEYAPEAVLTSFLWNWSPIYVYLAEQLKAGTLKAEMIYWGLEHDCGALAKFNDALVPADVQQEVADLKAKLASGEVQVFFGEIADNAGTVHGKAGEAMGDDIIGSMDWFVDNVDGSVS